MKKFFAIATAAFLSFPVLAAHADTTTVWFVPGPVDLRAGPDAAFPVVVTVPAQAHMDLQGCLQGWTWCDVSWNGDRGWVSGRDIESIYQNKTSYVTDIGETEKIPVLTYSTDTYWDSYYRKAPFYTQREHFLEWKPVPTSTTATSP